MNIDGPVEVGSTLGQRQPRRKGRKRSRKAALQKSLQRIAVQNMAPQEIRTEAIANENDERQQHEGHAQHTHLQQNAGRRCIDELRQKCQKEYGELGVQNIDQSTRLCRYIGPARCSVPIGISQCLPVSARLALGPASSSGLKGRRGNAQTDRELRPPRVDDGQPGCPKRDRVACGHDELVGERNCRDASVSSLDTDTGLANDRE